MQRHDSQGHVYSQVPLPCLDHHHRKLWRMSNISCFTVLLRLLLGSKVKSHAYLDALLGLNLSPEVILQLRCLLLLGSNLRRLHVCLVTPEVHLHHSLGLQLKRQISMGRRLIPKHSQVKVHV